MKYLYQNSILFILLLVCNALSISGYVTAQNKQFYFTHINENKENNNGRITSITKDLDGYIWYGTYDGLYRYDGYESKPFKYNEHDSTTVNDNLISTLFVDSKGTLWIGTFNGLNRFMPETATFKRYNINGRNNIGLPVLSITERKNGEIWCSSWGKGLFKIDPAADSLVNIKISDLPGLSRNSDNIKQIKADENDNLFVCTWGDGLLLYNVNEKTVRQFKHSQNNKASIPNDYVLNIENAGENKYVVACKHGYVSHFSVQDSSFKIIDNITAVIKKQKTEVTNLKATCSDHICISTYGAGVIVYNLSNEKIRYLKKERNNPHSLSSNLVTDIYFSKDDNLTWITTINGIDLRSPDVPKFRTFTHLKLPLRITEFNCQGFIYHLKDRICIATRNNGIWEFNTEDEKFKRIKFRHKQLHISKNILSIANKGNTVYAGTNKGLYIINHKDQNISIYNSSKKISPANDIIRYILTGEQDNIWLGTSSGLELFNEKTKTFSLFKPYPTMNTLSAKNLVRTICKSGDNILWVGTSTGGISKFDINKKQFTDRYIHESGEHYNILSDNKVNDIFIDSKKYVWIATGRGLNRLDTKSNTFKTLSSQNGLTDDNIYAIEEDDSGNIWFSTGKSIAKLNPTTWNFKEYNKFDGVTASCFNTAASLKLPDGKLMFGGVNGFNLFHPDSIKQNKFRPVVVLSGIKILNMPLKEYQKENNRNITDKSINYIKELNLKYNENSVTFKFAALNFSLPQKNQYTYILEGFDEKWISPSSNRIATYTNLPPGKYIFRIKATNNDKIWSPHEKSIVINIAPPFYKTWVFRLLLLLFLITIFILYNKIKTYKIKTQNEKLERVVREKTRELIQTNKYLEDKQEEIEVQNSKILSQKNELEKHKKDLEKIVHSRTREMEQAKIKAEKSEKLKTAFLANMSHEIRTPMNAIVGFSTLLKTPGLTTKEREEYIGYIKENSETLLVLIDNLLDLSQIESGNMYVRKEDFAVKDLISQMTRLYVSKYGSGNIKLINNFNNKAANTILHSDPNRLKQVIRNLLENAYKFTEKGTIEIGVDNYKENDKDYILFYVKDSGMGIPADRINKVFDRFRKFEMNTDKYYSGVGLGLSISKKIIENLEGKIWAESVEGEYAKFIFTIPLMSE